MKHTEYIVPIGEEAQDYDEMFIGVIRRQPEVVRCKDCARNPKYSARTHCPCPMDRYMGEDGWCAMARRKEK